jgi:hypothetical protein
MLQTIQVNPQINALSGGIAGQAAGSETGQFDFMNYLLGLESPALDLILPESSSNPLLNTATKEEGDAKDPLLDIFGKEGSPLWNPIFPNGMAQPNLTTPLDKTNLSETGAMPNQNVGVDARQEDLLVKGMGDSKAAPKTEKREESTEAFLQVHGDLTKTPLEVNPSKGRVIQKYAPEKEANVNGQTQSLQMDEKGVSQLTKQPDPCRKKSEKLTTKIQELQKLWICANNLS